MVMCTENYDPCFPDQPVVDRYLPVLARLPELAAKPAFIWADDDAASTRTALTYAELDAAVGLMARNLLAAGNGLLRRGDSVLVLASPGLRLVKLLFACQRAGLTAVPVMVPAADDTASWFDHDGPAHAHLLRAVSQTRPKAAVADARYVDELEVAAVAVADAVRWLAVDELEEEPAVPTTEVEEPYVGCGPDDVYLIQYTAGTTGGGPMPVVITAGSAAHNARAARKAYGLHRGSVVASWLPPYHDSGLMFLLTTVVAGATCVLAAPSAFARRPRLWLELVSEFRATCTAVPPFVLPLVLRRGRRRRRAGGRPLELGSLRSLILMGEPIYESCVSEFVAAFSCHGLRAACVSPSYGLAENCSFVSTAALPSSCSSSDSDSGSRRLPSYMKLLPSARLSSSNDDDDAAPAAPPEMEIVVVDEETGEPVEDGVEGEIWVSSPSNAAGYLGHPTATREVFCARVPAGRAGPCFVRTGDRGVVVRGAERYLYVVGRSADVIELHLPDGGGRLRRRVHAHYVETAAFSGAPDRLRGGCVAAFAMPSSSCGGVAVVAELQNRGGGGGGDGDSPHRVLCDGVRAAVWREEGVSVGLVVLVHGGVLPKTTSGKLRRGEARKIMADGKLPVLFQARYDDGDGGDGAVAGRGRVARDQEGETRMAPDTWMGQPAVPGESGRKTAGISRGLRLQSYL